MSKELQIKQIREFQALFWKKTEYNRLMSKLTSGIFGFCSFVMFLVPFQIQSRTDLKLSILGILFASTVLAFYTADEVGYMEQKKRVNLFQKIKYCPIDPKVVFEVIMKKCLCFGGKFLGVLSLAQLVSSIVSKQFSLQTILFLLGFWAAGFLTVFSQVYSAYKKHD